MTVQLWIGEEFETTHERRALHRFVTDMHTRFGQSDELYLILADYYIDGRQVDLTVLKRDAVIVIELQECDDPFRATENGDWLTIPEGQVLGTGGRNPFQQAKDYRFHWIDYLNDNVGKFLPSAKAKSMDFFHVSAFVAISPSLHQDTENNLPPRGKTHWFRLVGLDQLSEAVSQQTSQMLNFSDEELSKLVAADVLNLKQVNVDDFLSGRPIKATPQIFLSYARRDEERVEELYQKLSDAGFNPWMDKKDTLPGDRWESSIQEAIQRSDFLLVCLSANSVSRRGFLKREIADVVDIGQERLGSDIYLIPVRLEDCEVPESLRDFWGVVLFEENGWTQLVKAIQVRVERWRESTTFESYPAYEKPSSSGDFQVKARAQVFLNYAREDEERVEKLYHKLSDAGFKPWMDKKDILPGDRWRSSIQEAIRRSDFFLACLSANSVNKPGQSEKEIKEALDIGHEKPVSEIYLIPVRLEDCEVPESLYGFQWVDLFEENGWTRLAEAIQIGMERRMGHWWPGIPAYEEPSPDAGMATPKATAQVFLNYAREDEEKVERLYQKLSDAGFKPWMDKKDLLPGDRWQFRIQEAIRRSDFFLACLSANSVNKRGFFQKRIKNALDIWQEMLDSDIYLIPARLDYCEVPDSFDFQWVNLFEEDGWTRLVKAIQVGMDRRAGVLADEEPSLDMETTTPKPTAQIFLGYAREDEERVEKLYHKLSDAGFNPWMDKKDLLPGERWRSNIEEAIRRSDFFLGCLSANSISRKGSLKREFESALDVWQERLDGDIYLIPVRLEDCEVPESLRDFQWVDLFEEDGWTRLVKAIQVGMERQAEVAKSVVEKSSEEQVRQEFKVTMEKALDRIDYPVHASSPVGSATGAFVLPFSMDQIEQALQNFREGIPLGRYRRERGKIQFEELSPQGFGSALFRALFRGEVLALYRESLMAGKSGVIMPVKLNIIARELARLPWELLYDPERGEFLSFATDTPVIRFVDWEPRPYTFDPPLRVLLVSANPSDTPLLNLDRESKVIGEALDPLKREGKVRIDYLFGATLPELRQKFREYDPHVVHFMGHGQVSRVLLEDGGGEGLSLAESSLEITLRNVPSLRMVVLNACETARPADSEARLGLAHRLARRGVPAIVAMQFQISDGAASEFAEELYRVLAEGFGVDEAVLWGRIAVQNRFADDIEWVTPVLYMQDREGRIFDDLLGASKKAIEPIVVTDYESGLSQLLSQIEQDHPRHREALVYQQRLVENVKRSRRYGDTDAHKAERAEIIELLNELALSVLGIPFSELCVPIAPTRYFLIVSHSAKAGALVGDMVRLSLRLAPKYLTSSSIPIEVFQGEVSFFIQAEGFHIPEGEDVITLSLPAQGKEEVETTVELQARLPGARQITIEPFYDGQRHPPLSIPVSVRFDKDVKKRPELPSPLTLRPVPQPDLCLRVYTFPLNPEASRLRLEYVLYSPLYQLRLPGVPVGSVEVSAVQFTRLRAQLDRLLRRASPAGSEELQEGLKSVGRELYTMLFSSRLKEIYCEVWDKVTSWLVLCDADPWIPWELVKPHGQKWEHDFLAARYSLGRWIEGWGVSRQAEFPIRAVYFAPDAGLAGHRAMEEWTELLASGDVPRLKGSLLVDWPGGYPASLAFSSPVWGLHFESYPERLSPALRGLVAQDTERFSSEEVAERRLDLRQKRPVVTFGMLALERQTALTEVEVRWMPTFVQSGASAFIGPLWATGPQADRIFWRAFYQALWGRVPLGEAMLTARRSLRQALPDSLDWVAYFMVGDPMARGYVPHPGDGYIALECRNHDLTQPMQMNETYSFVASLRATPPPWYTGRLYQAQEEAWDDPQVFVFAPGFDAPQAPLPVDMRMSEIGRVQFDLVPKVAGEHDVFVKFLAGEEVRQSLTLHVDVESKREGQG